MQFDPLPNPDAAESLAHITQDYQNDPEAALLTVEADVCALERAIAAAQDRAAQVLEGVQRAAAVSYGGAVSAADAMPVSRTLFRERVDNAQFALLCRAVAKIEEGHGMLRESLLEYAHVGEDLRACYITAFSLKRRVYAVKRAARNASEAERLTAYAARLRKARGVCETLEADLQARRERVGGLCFDTLKRFADALRVRADLEGDGERCDASAVRSLCVELQQALQSFL